MLCSVRWLLVMILVLALVVPALVKETQSPDAPGNDRPLIQVFYKTQPPSLQTYEKVKAFLDPYQDEYEIQFLLMTSPANAELMKQLGLPTEHFPFGLAVDGKTSALIDGDTIVFSHFPDFMHHIGRHQGNWTLDQADGGRYSGSP